MIRPSLTRKQTVLDQTMKNTDTIRNSRWATGKSWGSVALALAIVLMTAINSSAQQVYTPSGQGTTGHGRHAKISADLANMPAGASVDVIVQFSSSRTPADDHAAKSLGGTRGKALGTFMKWSMSAANAAKLAAADANVKYISPDRPLQAAGDAAMISTVNADLALAAGYDGSGVAVAVIDSGVNDVPDFSRPGTKSSRVLYSQNFDPSFNTTADLFGHGTHVAGIIAGNGTSSSCGNCTTTYRGIAPQANIISLRALDANGRATDSAVIAAIQTAIALKWLYNIRVLNLSLGRGIFESYTLDPLCQAVEQAWRAGIIVVIAAGNNGRDNSNNNHGYATITSPGNDPYAITVGAMRDVGTPLPADDVIATYSSKGPTMLDHVVKPDLVAPGNLIVSDLASTSDTLYTEYPQNLVPVSEYTSSNTSNISSTYFRLSGTSMAAGVVSGAAALLVEQNPALTPDQVKARLMLTASKSFPQYSTYTDPNTGIVYNEQYDIFTIGAGYLDTYAALNSSALASGNLGAAVSPTASYDSSTGQTWLVNANSVIWGSSASWATSVVWGTSVIWGTNVSGQSVIWGSSACWSTSTNSAFSVIWGSSVIWGANTGADALTIAVGGDR